MLDARGRTTLDRAEANRRGMLLAVHAREAPERSALVTCGGERSFAALNARGDALNRQYSLGDYARTSSKR